MINLPISEADLIAIIRSLRHLTATLDSIGYQTKQLEADEELAAHITRGINSKITGVATDIHNMVQRLENTKRYKDAVRQLCCIKETDDGREY